MKEIFEKRINNLRAGLPEKTAALVTNEENIGYFTGFFHSEGAFLLTENRAVLLVDFRYIEAAQKKAQGCEVICFKRLNDSLLEILKSEGVFALSFEAERLSYRRAFMLRERLEKENITLIDDSSLDRKIEELRIIKDESELEKLQTAQNIAERAYNELLNFIRPGVTERELSARLEYLMKTYGAEDISFSLITVTGKKTSLPHGVPSDCEVRRGDFFTCDFGAMYEGYHSDTTRTVAVGEASDEMKKIYATVLEAQLAALEKIKPGVKCSDVDKTARDIITEAGYGEYFGHSTGHGVGIEIHEAPAVSSRCDTILRPGMVITDEPGIYLPDKFGVRIEDMLCVTEDGYRNFVNLTKDLLVV